MKYAGTPKLGSSGVVGGDGLKIKRLLAAQAAAG
jgi:hypothetical protein